MCGINGIIAPEITDKDHMVIKQMNSVIQHRGPDDENIASTQNIILGHTRLSIIDLTQNASQPMHSDDGRYILSYNGEVYNFLQIKSELKKQGYVFKSSSDTEVVLYSLIHYGTKAFDLFNGMYAIAFWDDQKRTLLLARDRFGKKPLFYTRVGNGRFAFSSDLRCFRQCLDTQEPDMESVNCYLALGYILSPRTIYKDVLQLEPSTYMVVNDKGVIIEKNEYWKYEKLFEVKSRDSEAEIEKNILQLLENAVKRRLIADVPVGAFLSGGIDSSSVVALMRRHHIGDLHTFSVGFKQGSYNELPDANKIADHLGTIHHGMVLDKFDQSDLLGFVRVYDQPLSDNSIVPMIHVSEIASEKVKVVLSGDGADEMFGGYITNKADKYYNILKRVPGSIKTALAERKHESINKKMGRRYRYQQFFYAAGFNYKQAHTLWRNYFRPEERIKILGTEYSDLVYDTDPFHRISKLYDKVSHLEPADQHQFVDVKTWLADDILVKVDRATMNSSIEARSPFLDIDLVAYAASIPFRYKLNLMRTKYILKRSMSCVLPDYVIKKQKSGFNAPVNQWLEKQWFNEFQDFNLFALNCFNLINLKDR